MPLPRPLVPADLGLTDTVNEARPDEDPAEALHELAGTFVLDPFLDGLPNQLAALVLPLQVDVEQVALPAFLVGEPRPVM